MMFIVCFVLFGFLTVAGGVDTFEVVQLLINGSEEEVSKISRDDLLDAIWAINRITLPINRLHMVWTTIKGSQGVKKLSFEDVITLGNFVLMIPENDLYGLDYSNRQLLNYFGTMPGMTRRKASIVIYAVGNTQKIPVLKDVEHINLIKGLLCGYSRRTLQNLPIRTFLRINGTVFNNLHSCTSQQLHVLLQTASKARAYGPYQIWTELIVKKLGLLILAMTTDEIRMIRPQSMSGLSVETIERMSNHQLEAITHAQLQYLNLPALAAYRRKSLAQNAAPTITPHLPIIITFLIVTTSI